MQRQRSTGRRAAPPPPRCASFPSFALPPLSIARDEPSGPFIGRLSVEPEVLEARAVVDAVDHVGEALHLRLPAGRNAAVEDDRPRVVLDQLLLDLPDQPLARARIGLSGLLLDQPIDLP